MINPDEVRRNLAALRDVEGVTGSFVFARTGRVLARELPQAFDDGALMEAGGRLARLRETFAAVGDDLGAAVIRFRDYKLYLRTLSGGILCVVATTDVNMPAMRMAANLVGRRIAPALESIEVASLTAVREFAPGMRRFRGRTVE